jgi:HK97 family phage major capsid protein
MSDLSEVKALIVDQGRQWEAFTKRNDARMTDLEARLGDLEKRNGREALFGAAAGSARATSLPKFIDQKSKALIPVLGPEDRLSDLGERKSGEADVSVGRFLRGIALGGAADDAKALEDERKSLAIISDPAGGYTVQGALARQWIDLLRAEMVLQRAGARTVPMSTKSLTLAKLTADPTVSWHGENAALTASDPTFGAVTLDARTVVGLVKLSLELSQDSVNIEEILQRSLIQATAHAIDSAGLVGVTTDAAAAPVGIFDLPDRNTVTSIGAPTTWGWVVDGMYELMLDNVPANRIGALIGHPAVWKKMRKLATGITNDNTPLLAPAEVAAIPKLWTTAAPLDGSTAKCVMGDWSDLLFGVRQDIQVRVLNSEFLADTLSIAVLVYARVDFAATRAASFVTLEGLTVS